MLFRRKDLLPANDYDADLPEKTGAARFWELIKDELPAVLVANLLFLVTCVPIITIPPALFSLHMVVRKIILGKPVACSHDYFEAFRRNWKRAYGAFSITVVPMGISGYGAVFYLLRASELPVLLAPFALCATVFLVTTLGSTYLYGILCEGRPLRDAVKTAMLLGIVKPLRAILAALCYYGTPALAILYFPISGMYLLLIGFSLPFLLGSFYVRTVLKQYCGNENIPNE